MTFSNRNHIQPGYNYGFYLECNRRIIPSPFIAINSAIIFSFSKACFFLWIIITSSPFLESLGVLEKLRAREELTSASIYEMKLL